MFWFQEASRVLHSNACWPLVTDGVTMFLEVLLDILLTPAPQPLGKYRPLSRHREWSKNIRQNSVSLCQAIGHDRIGPRRCVYGARLYRSNCERVDRRASGTLLTPDFCYGLLEVEIKFTTASTAVGH
jgi:hypothetical protein